MKIKLSNVYAENAKNKVWTKQYFKKIIVDNKQVVEM